MRRLLLALAFVTAWTGAAFAQSNVKLNPSNATPIDCSGTITTGGTAQPLFTANKNIIGFQIWNIDTAEPLWLSFTGTAAAATIGSFPVPAATATTFANAGTYVTTPTFGPNTAVSIIGATSTHKYTCVRW